LGFPFLTNTIDRDRDASVEVSAACHIRSQWLLHSQYTYRDHDRDTVAVITFGAPMVFLIETGHELAGNPHTPHHTQPPS